MYTKTKFCVVYKRQDSAYRATICHIFLNRRVLLKYIQVIEILMYYTNIQSLFLARHLDWEIRTVVVVRQVEAPSVVGPSSSPAAALQLATAFARFAVQTESRPSFPFFITASTILFTSMQYSKVVWRSDKDYTNHLIIIREFRFKISYSIVKMIQNKLLDTLNRV